MKVHYVPYITTPAAACLTQENWRELGIHYAICDLKDILIKPSLDFWDNGMNLKTYLAWDGCLFLDASGLKLPKEFVVKSPYDGTQVKINFQQFWSLIEQWQPDGIVFAEGSANLGHTGLKGVFSKPDELCFDFKECRFTASDLPAQHAMQGVVYHSGGKYSLLSQEYALDFQLLDENCACPTCQQSFTRAYLHYLYQSTPLLCQRFLLMHNVFCHKVIYVDAKSRYDVST